MPSEQSSSAHGNLAVASVVAGSLALVLCRFPVAAFLGAIGLVLGVTQVWRRQGGKKAAWAGVTLSTVGLGVGLVYNLWYFPSVLAKAQQQYYEQMIRWKGVAAPDFTFTTLQGRKMKLSDLQGRRVILDFWATWCPPCLAEIPSLARLRQDIPATDLYLVGISSDDTNTLASFVPRTGIDYPIATMAEAPPPYEDALSMLPTTLFIDRRGVIQEVTLGYHDFEALKRLALAPDTEGPPKPPPEPAENIPATTNR